MKKPLIILVIVFGVLLVCAITLLICLETGLIATPSQGTEPPAHTSAGTTNPEPSESGSRPSQTFATEDPNEVAPEITLPEIGFPTESGTQPDPTGTGSAPDPDENETPHMEF